jgi:hypothetical protein
MGAPVAGRVCRPPPPRWRTSCRPHRPAVAAAAAPSTSTSSSSSTADYVALKDVTVYRTPDGAPVPLASTFRAGPGDKTLLFVLTHGADLAPYELVPLVIKALPRLTADAGVQVVFVVLGSPANAAAFAQRLAIPPALLFSDPTAATHDALGFSKGFDPSTPKLSPYLRLGAMLAGIGSPGTIGRVIKGYVGDAATDEIFTNSPFDVLGKGRGQRPMERATQRLFNMGTVLAGWGELAPPDPELLTRLGGAVVLKGRETVLRHADAGILDYVDFKEACAAVGVVKALPE